MTPRYCQALRPCTDGPKSWFCPPKVNVWSWVIMISQFVGVCRKEISRARQPTNHESTLTSGGVRWLCPTRPKKKMTGRGKVFIEICKTLSVKVGVTKKIGRANCSQAFVKRCWLFVARWLLLGHCLFLGHWLFLGHCLFLEHWIFLGP